MWAGTSPVARPVASADHRGIIEKYPPEDGDADMIRLAKDFIALAERLEIFFSGGVDVQEWACKKCI
jgi:hypothetical protein